MRTFVSFLVWMRLFFLQKSPIPLIIVGMAINGFPETAIWDKAHGLRRICLRFGLG
jgi:hypothetical protein